MFHHRRSRTDAELVRAVLQGHTQQFGVLVERYQHLLHHLLLARVSRFEEAEDLTQEAFLRAFRRLDELEEPAKFGPWLRRIGENLAYGALRSRKIAQAAVPDWVPTEPDDPERLYVAQEQCDQIWAALDRLSLEQREAVLLYYLENYTQDRVAAFLDISVGAVKLRLIRARAALREELAGELDQQVAQAVRTRRLRQGFSGTVMSTLPLVPWHLSIGHSLLAGGRLGWALALGLSIGMGTLGTVLGLGHWQGWWSPPPAASPHPSALALLPGQDLAQIAGEHGIRIRWAPTEPAVPSGGADGSLFGGETLSLQARARQEEALRQGQGGRLVWDFEGTGTQGWRAREMPMGTLPPRVLPVEARDGVLRILVGGYEPGRVPTVVLISPEIGYDARLFDRVEVRLRLVPPAAVRGGLSLTWTTPRNRSFPGQDPEHLRRLSVAERQAAWERMQRGERQPRFALPTRGSWIFGLFWAADTAAVPLGPGWQDLVVEGLHEDPVMGWEGDLVDLRLHLSLADLRRTATFGEALDPAAFPRAVEIDRIVLRDAHRSLAVNLDPPAARARPAAGFWLGNGRFYPLSQPGLRWPLLGDLDGDGDLDLVVSYRTDNATGGTRQGWVTARNDGNGRFTAGAAQALSNWCGRVEGADLNQDGRLDLVVAQGTDTWLFLNQGHGVFAADRIWADWLYIGRGDVDGDGKVDLVLEPFDEASLEQPVASRASRATLFVNYGQAVFAEQEVGAPAATGWSPYALDDFNGDGRAELVWHAGWVEDGPEERSE
ncbi:MAG: sigma-70 family RNA polymerase sigma factor, partial [Candidatus Latescibacterota bacterium]